MFFSHKASFFFWRGVPNFVYITTKNGPGIAMKTFHPVDGTNKVKSDVKLLVRGTLRDEIIRGSGVHVLGDGDIRMDDTPRARSHLHKFRTICDLCPFSSEAFYPGWIVSTRMTEAFASRRSLSRGGGHHRFYCTSQVRVRCCKIVSRENGSSGRTYNVITIRGQVMMAGIIVG